MRLTVATGSVRTSGQVSSTGLHVRLMEWHAHEDNVQAVFVGGSDVSTASGRELPPGASVTWDFTGMGRSGEPGFVRLSDLYVAIQQAGDVVDWTIFTAND